MKYKIDVVRIRENSIELNGWVVGKNPESKATFRVLDEKKQPVKFKCVSTRRDDVSHIYFKKIYDKDFGFFCSLASMCVALVYLVMKLIWWDRFPAGMAPMLIGMLFLGSVQIFFIGLLGEYIMSINQRVMKRPLVIEEERLNFEAGQKGGDQ